MSKRRTLATVDLGSNSFHLLVVRLEGSHISTLDTIKEPVRLAWGLQPDGSLDSQTQNRAVDVLRLFSQRLRGVRASNIRVVGTDTLRRARHNYEFLKRVEEILGVGVEIIGEREEARLIYLGVASNLPMSDLRNFVVDIGGGSTELVLGQNLEPSVRESRSMGCIGFTRDFFPEGQISRKRIRHALIRVAKVMEGYRNKFGRFNWDRAIGSSGTIRAIGSILSASGQSVETITREGLEWLMQQVQTAKSVDQLTLPGLKEDRKPVFMGGFCVLYGLFDILNMDRMDVSTYSLRDGVLFDFMGREQNQDKREETVKWLMDFYGVDKNQAKRVKRTILHLFLQVMSHVFTKRQSARRLLSWAADLHEIGLAIAHSGYQKHGAYILLNADLDGFSKVEQGKLSFLVLNHRKSIKPDPLPYEDRLEWPLVLIFRLACMFNRERMDIKLPDVAITWKKRRILLSIDEGWLANHPLTRYDLEHEQLYWEKVGYRLTLNGR